MPSRSNRLRSRRALGGDTGSDSLSASGSGSEEVLSSPTPAPKRSSTSNIRSTDKAKSKASPRPRGKSGKAATVVDSEPGRLKRLLALLLVTTLLLTLYHVFRLYTKGQGILGAPASLGRRSGSSSSSFSHNKDAPGGMVVHPSAPSPSSDNEDIRLEDLDMETLQAAFDALYGDGGPLGPGSQRGDGSGEYRVAGRRKESLH